MSSAMCFSLFSGIYSHFLQRVAMGRLIDACPYSNCKAAGARNQEADRKCAPAMSLGQAASHADSQPGRLANSTASRAHSTAVRHFMHSIHFSSQQASWVRTSAHFPRHTHALTKWMNAVENQKNNNCLHVYVPSRRVLHLHVCMRICAWVCVWCCVVSDINEPE